MFKEKKKKERVEQDIEYKSQLVAFFHTKSITVISSLRQYAVQDTDQMHKKKTTSVHVHKIHACHANLCKVHTLAPQTLLKPLNNSCNDEGTGASVQNNNCF